MEINQKGLVFPKKKCTYLVILPYSVPLGLWLDLQVILKILL